MNNDLIFDKICFLLVLRISSIQLLSLVFFFLSKSYLHPFLSLILLSFPLPLYFNPCLISYYALARTSSIMFIRGSGSRYIVFSLMLKRYILYYLSDRDSGEEDLLLVVFWAVIKMENLSNSFSKTIEIILFFFFLLYSFNPEG